ncbi:MAG: hypothetical protein MR601_04130 [Erysipelotrichaceae bacterium]|nr:hypothetical protein [Erysipelotrichaceae bacterium]
MNKKYNEFIQQKPNQMAQTISDMTYMYKETVVPKEHYKKILEEVIEEEMSEIIQYQMLEIVYKNLKHLYEESPQLFFKGLMCIFKKIKPNDIRPVEQKALAIVSDELFTNQKYYSILNQELLNMYDEILKGNDIKPAYIITEKSN